VHGLRFESAAARVTVHLGRRYMGVGTGESSLYELDEMLVADGDACTRISDGAALSYTNTHHNWRDEAAGTAGDGTTYRVAMSYDVTGAAGGRWSLTLTRTAAGAAAGQPLALVATGGPVGSWGAPHFIPVQSSEILPDNRGGWRDEVGEADPWIELFNPSAEAVMLGGYLLSVDPSHRAAWSFAAGTSIGRHQTLLVIADGEPAEGPLHTSFRLAPGGGPVVLSAPDGTTPGERSHGAAAPDQSFAFDLATDSFVPAPAPTPGVGPGE
jgi:hypothetical protein